MSGGVSPEGGLALHYRHVTVSRDSRGHSAFTVTKRTCSVFLFLTKVQSLPPKFGYLSHHLWPFLYHQGNPPDPRCEESNGQNTSNRVLRGVSEFPISQETQTAIPKNREMKKK